MLKKRLNNELALSTIYKNRALDGQALISEYKGLYASWYHKEEITYQEMSMLETEVKPVLDWLETGDFMTAKHLLNSINNNLTVWLKEKVDNYVDYSYEYSWVEDFIDRMDSGKLNVSGDLDKADAILEVRAYIDSLGDKVGLFVNGELSYEELPKIADFAPTLSFSIIHQDTTYTTAEFVNYISSLRQSKSEKFLDECFLNVVVLLND